MRLIDSVGDDRTSVVDQDKLNTEVILGEVINCHFVDNRLEEFANDTKEIDGSIPRWR